jgi:hypothetical protein
MKRMPHRQRRPRHLSRQPRLPDQGREIREMIPAIMTSIVEIDRKCAGVISEVGIMMSNSASIPNIRLTMSIEVNPACASSSSTDRGRVIEFFARISSTSRVNRSLDVPGLRFSISTFSESSSPLSAIATLIQRETGNYASIDLSILPISDHDLMSSRIVFTA